MKKIICVLTTLTAFSYSDEINLQDVNIDASLYSSSGMISQGKYGSSVVYDKNYLNNSTKGDGTVSDVIKRNPNVRVSRGERTSKNGGEITPQNISINGASFYQNNFMIDGVNINNDINPLGGVLTVGGAANITPFLSNPSQGINVDTDILENIEVQDSSVSAKYGNFQGGVVNAKTRDPRAGFHGKVSFRYTSDSLQKFHIAKEHQDDFEFATTPDYQPDFKKYKTSVLFEGYITDNFGLIFNYNQTYSEILQQKYHKEYVDPSKVGEKRKLKRKNENFFLKGVWFANDNLTIRPSIIYAPYEATYYSMGGENAKAEVEGGGLTTAIEFDYDFGLGNLKQNLSYTTNEMTRNTNTNKMLVWNKTKNHMGYSSAKTRTYIDGIGGDVEQEQEKFSYSADMKFNEFDIGMTKHNVITGFSLEKTDAAYDIAKPYYRAISTKNLGAFSCNPNDIFCTTDRPLSFPTWTGQYFDKHYYYSGKTDVDMKYFSFYLEDEIKIDRFTIRPGIRFDKNDYMGDLNVAPRITANLDLFNDDRTNIFGGYNRYYGRSIFAYKLRENMSSLMQTYTRNNPNDPWKYDSTKENNYNFSELDVPYDDEYAIGISQKLGNFELSAKYLRREGKDLIRKSNAKAMGLPQGDGKTLAKNYSLYTNTGRSKSDIYTLNLRSLNEFDILGSKNNFEISFNYTDTDRNFNDYDDLYDELYQNAGKVVYNGNLIHSSQLPNNSNDTPWTLTASTFTKFLSANLTWTNFFTLQGGFDGVVRDGSVYVNSKKYSNYKSKDFDEAFVWDTKFTLDIPTQKRQEAYVSLDIYNVLNTKNAITIDNNGVTDYDNGRQFWLEVGYKW